MIVSHLRNRISAGLELEVGTRNLGSVTSRRRNNFVNLQNELTEEALMALINNNSKGMTFTLVSYTPEEINASNGTVANSQRGC